MQKRGHHRITRRSNLSISHNRRRQGFLSSLLGIGSSLLGGMGSSAAGAATAASAQAMMEAAGLIEDKTDDYRKIVRKDGKKFRQRTGRALSSVGNVNNYPDLDFNRARGISSFLDEAQGLSANAFSFMTDQKRSNQDYAVGRADDGLRKTQFDFSRLAAGDTSGFNEIVQASAFGALAESAGMPMGAFANTSAKNMMDFRRMGTEGAMGISDFFAKQGTVDPINPLDSISKLAGFEQIEDARSGQLDTFNRELDFNLNKFNMQTKLSKANMSINAENSIFQTFADMEATALSTYADAYEFAAGGAGGAELGQATALGGIGQAVGQIGGIIKEGGGLSGMFGGMFGG